VTSIDIKCSTNVVAHFSYTLDGSAVSIIARHYEISDKALSNFFEQINNESVPPYLVTQRLDTLVKEIKRLRSELRVVAVTEKVRSLWIDALAALDEGRVQQAISLHKQIIEDSQPALDKAFNTIRDAARTKRSLGELYLLTYDYQKAIEQFSNAVDILPLNSKIERARIYTLWAEAVEQVSSDPGTALKLAREAVSGTEDALEQAPEWHLRALSALMKAMIFNRDPKGALNTFHNRISPLLNRDDLKGSVWGVLCFACAGDALMDLGDYRGAVEVLQRGLDYSDNQFMPDKVVLAKIYINLAEALPKIMQDRREAQKFFFESLAIARSLLLEAFPDEGHPDLAWVYYNAGKETRDKAAKSDYYLHAFKIMNQVMPYENGAYTDLLEAIVKPEDAPMPGLPSVIVHLFEPDDGYFITLYDMYMDNARRLSADDVEIIASASNTFTGILAKTRRYKQSLQFCRKTAELYKEKSYGRNLGIALFGCAQIADEVGDSSNIENDYKGALEVFTTISGNLSPESRGVRLALAGFYAQNNRHDDLNKLIKSFRSSISSDSKNADVESHFSELTELLKPW
jgi:tetratricopeptide (TPR) repeat protein